MKSEDAKAPNSNGNSIKNDEHFKTSSLKRKATTENINVKKKKNNQWRKCSTHCDDSIPEFLITAANLGYLRCIEYLVERRGANVKQTSTVIIDGKTVIGASPLWCAAAAGHLDIVTYLLEKCNVNVNIIADKTKSTPVTAACFAGHLNVVMYLVGECKADVEIADIHGNTCLMIACQNGHAKIVDYLVSVAAADVNRKTLVERNTALHNCSDSVEIMKLLLNHGAKLDITNKYGVTPAIAASIEGKTSIIQYLVENDLISRKEKIDSLELLGATFVDRGKNMKALKIWKWAATHENRVPKLQHSSLLANILGITIKENKRIYYNNLDEIYYKALSIRERVLGPIHPETSECFRKIGLEYGENGDIDRCINLWIYCLDMEQRNFQSFNLTFQYSFMLSTELLCFVLIETKRKYNSISYRYFCNVMRVFKKCVKQIEKDAFYLSDEKNNKNKYQHYFHRMLVIVLHLASLLAKIEPLFFDDEGCYEFRETLGYLVTNINPTGINGGVSLLHLAFSKNCSLPSIYSFSLGTIKFPDLKLVNLLLQVGATYSSGYAPRSAVI